MGPFNHIVTWTWPLFGLVAVLYSIGLAAHSKAAGNILVSSSYALTSGILSSNICAGSLYTSGDPESFAVCDVVGIGTAAVVESVRIHYTFKEDEWEYVKRLPENATFGVFETFQESVDKVKQGLMRMLRAARLTSRKQEDF